MTDTIPVEPAAELSLDNVLTNIRFRGEAGLKLKDFNFSSDFTSVDLEFVPCTSEAKVKRKFK